MTSWPDLQSVQVLRQTSVTHLLKAEDPLDHTKHVLNLGTDAGLATVGGLDRLINAFAPPVPLIGKVEAHVFVALLSYCLYVTLGRQLKPLAPGLSARSALEKVAAVQMVDMRIPTTDAREILLTRYTQPESELELLLERLHLTLSAQPPPKISAAQNATTTLL